MQYVSNNLKDQKENPSGRSYRAVLAKLATLRELSKALKNFPIQLINPLSDSSCKDFALCKHSGNGTMTL